MALAVLNSKLTTVFDISDSQRGFLDHDGVSSVNSLNARLLVERHDDFGG